MENASRKSQKWIPLGLGATLFLFILFGCDLDPDNRLVTRMAAVSVLMGVWWLTEAIPLAITALVPIVLFPFLGIMTGKDVSTLYINHIVFLFIGGFMVALAIEKWDLHRRIALKILKTLGVQAGRVLMGFMIATAFLSMWISNTATAMMMVPIALSVTARLAESADDMTVRSYSKAIFLGIAYSASIGGIATLVGTPPNMVFARIYEQSMPDAPAISFARWMLFALPISLVFLAICWFVLCRVFRLNKLRLDLDETVFENEYSKLGSMTVPERRILMASVSLAVLWIFRGDIGLGFMEIPGWSRILNEALGGGDYAQFVTDGTVAILIAVLLFILPAGDRQQSKLLDWPTAVKLPWDIVLLFGGGFALADGFKQTGLTEWMGNQMHGLAGMPPVVIIGCICLLATFLTEFTSNTGTTQIFLPVMVAVAAAIHVDPLLLMIPATLACSCAFMLPVATPPNAIIFGTGHVTVHDMSRAGVILNLLGVVIITAGVYLLGLWVFNIPLP